MKVVSFLYFLIVLSTYQSLHISLRTTVLASDAPKIPTIKLISSHVTSKLRLAQMKTSYTTLPTQIKRTELTSSSVNSVAAKSNGSYFNLLNGFSIIIILSCF